MTNDAARAPTLQWLCTARTAETRQNPIPSLGPPAVSLFLLSQRALRALLLAALPRQPLALLAFRGCRLAPRCLFCFGGLPLDARGLSVRREQRFSFWMCASDSVSSDMRGSQLSAWAEWQKTTTAAVAGRADGRAQTKSQPHHQEAARVHTVVAQCVGGAILYLQRGFALQLPPRQRCDRRQGRVRPPPSRLRSRPRPLAQAQPPPLLSVVAAAGRLPPPPQRLFAA